MRRDEFEVKEKDKFENLLNECEYITLCLNDTPFCYQVPLSFAYKNNFIFFHGSKHGRKYELIQKTNLASISIVKLFSFIPSYFRNSTLACPATQFFASAFCEGFIKIEQDIGKKAKILELLMQKYQDKNSYLDFEKNPKLYKNMLEKTAVFAFEIKNYSLKIKLAQNLNKPQKEELIKCLKDRGENRDILTINEIDKLTCKN